MSSAPVRPKCRTLKEAMPSGHGEGRGSVFKNALIVTGTDWYRPLEIADMVHQSKLPNVFGEPDG